MKSRGYYAIRVKAPEDATSSFGRGTRWRRLPGSPRDTSIMLQRSWRSTCAASTSRRGRPGPEEDEQHEGWSTEEFSRPADLHRDGRWSWMCTQWRVIAFGALNLFGACHSLFSHQVGCCIVLSWCRWTHVGVFMGVFLVLFVSLGPWLRATTLLWGGVLMRCILGRYFVSFLFGPYFAFFSVSGCFGIVGFFLPPPGACPGA